MQWHAGAGGCSPWQILEGSDQYSCQLHGYQFAYLSGYEASKSAALCYPSTRRCRDDITTHWTLWSCVDCVRAYSNWYVVVDLCAQQDQSQCATAAFDADNSSIPVKSTPPAALSGAVPPPPPAMAHMPPRDSGPASGAGDKASGAGNTSASTNSDNATSSWQVHRAWYSVEALFVLWIALW